MRTFRLAPVVLAAALAACAAPAVRKDQFLDHVDRTYRPAEIVLVGIADYRATDGARRCHAVAAIPDDATDGWRLVWTDFAPSARRKWTPIHWPHDPHPRFATLPQAREAGSGYLRRFKAGEAEMGEILEW